MPRPGIRSNRQLARPTDPAVTADLPVLSMTIAIGGKQVHDANIVATIQVYDLRRLLTRNTADFARFAALIQVEPLVASP